MKKAYETPSVEVVKFQYRDQVVVASGLNSHDCTIRYTKTNDYVDCKDDSYWISKG